LENEKEKKKKKKEKRNLEKKRLTVGIFGIFPFFFSKLEKE